MQSVDVVDQKNKKIGTLELKDEVFGVRPHKGAMFQVVRSHLARARAGTASTKTRGEVNYTSAKPYRQKGTGRARAGFRGSPIWRGGGITFGPKPRTYDLKVPKKVRQLALKSALSSKVMDGNLKIVERLDIKAPKTRDLLNILKDLGLSGKTLIVTAEAQESVILSGRNVPDIAVMEVGRVNVYDLLNMEKILMTRDAVEKISEALSA
ncbi:MAG: 50S ribosomal protein L4 [bacterium]